MLLKLLLISSCLISSNFAQKISSADPDNLVEIDHLIVNATISKIGNDFYDIFYNSWTQPPDSPNFNIVISEKPYPGRGNLISIEMNDHIIFNRFVTPRYDEIVEVANLAVKSLQNYIINYNEIQQQINGDDLVGNGIY